MNDDMATGTRREAAAGFTLIEVLLAIGITATVMLTVGTTFHIMLNARDVVDDLAESSEAGPRILKLIERDLRGLWTYNVRNNAVFRGVQADVNGRDADRMSFLTTTDSVGTVQDLESNAHRTTLCEVGYLFKPNPRFREVFELWRREDPMVDDDLTTQGDQGTFQLVYDRIKSFRVRYFDTLGWEAEELFEWDSAKEDRLPKRIMIEFTIERKRSSRNVVSDVEIEDFEGAEKKYVRHFVLPKRLEGVLLADNARIPVLPPARQVRETQAHGPINTRDRLLCCRHIDAQPAIIFWFFLGTAAVFWARAARAVPAMGGGRHHLRRLVPRALPMLAALGGWRGGRTGS